MSSLLLIPSLYLFINSGGNCLEVYTPVGGDAVLPCAVVDPTTDILAVEWSRPDLPPDQYVHFQRNGEESDDDKSPAFRGRTSLFMDEVKKGNVSLKLSRVKPSDAGTYTCLLPDIPKTFTVQLIVLSTDDVSGGHEVRPSVAASNVNSGNTADELDEVGGFPWWGHVIIFLCIMVPIISVLVCKKRQFLEFVRKFHTPEIPAGDEFRPMNGESAPMNGV